MEDELVIEVHCIKHTYPDNTPVKICGLDLVVNKAEKVAILGPNGCGKTTLLKHILGVVSAQEGLVRVFGFDPYKHFDKIRQNLGVVMQNIDEQIIGPTVYDDILFAPLNYNYPKKDAIKMADAIMERLKITHLKNKVPYYLSGGEKKKVALAGALVMEPKLLVLDEPFSNLDSLAEAEIIDILKEINKIKNITIVTALNNVDVVSQIADVLYLMSSSGELSFKGRPADLLGDTQLLRKYNLGLRHF